MKKHILFLFSLMLVLCGICYSFFADAHAAAGLITAVIPGIGSMSRDDLERLAEEVLTDNYEDDYEGFDDLDDDDLYDGFDDQNLEFMGNSRSFLDEKKAGVYLTFKITNNCGYAKVVAFNPAYFDTTGITLTKKGSGEVTDATINHTNVAEMRAAGILVDAIIADGLIYGTTEAGITVTGVNGRINDHLRFTNSNPTRIPQITISSNKLSTGAIDTTIYSKIVTIRQVSPYRTFGDSNIDLNDYFKTDQFQSGKIDVDTANHKLQADDQTVFFMEIDNDMSVTFKFNIGGNENRAALLFKKADKAHRNIQKGTAGKVDPQRAKVAKKVAAKQLKVMRKLAFGRKK